MVRARQTRGVSGATAAQIQARADARPGTRKARVFGVAATALVLAAAAGCSQSSSPPAANAAGASAPSTTSGATTSGGAALESYGITGALPVKLRNGTIKIALVRQLSQGDFFEQWLAGAQAEAKALNVKLEVSSGNGNNAQQALYLQEAINEEVDAIIVDHGFPQTMQPVIAKAKAAGIPLVAFDVDPGVATDPVLDQADKTVAAEALSLLKTNSGGKAQVIYAYVAGYRPLDLRNETWVAFKKANPGIKQVAQVGVVNSDTTSQTANQIKAALLAHPGVTAIFAPYDAFAQGALLAIDELGLQKKVKIYGADVSTADIDAMTQAKSPWVDTAATDPADVGEVAVRAAVRLVLGLSVPADLVIPPQLITQSFLTSHSVSNMSQLVADLPGLNTPTIASIP
jgi:simple sugar transport system substrate-binding protein